MWLISDSINVILPNIGNLVNRCYIGNLGNLYASQDLECQVLGILLLSLHALCYNIASVFVKLPFIFLDAVSYAVQKISLLLFD